MLAFQPKMNRKTHRRIAKALLPNLPTKKIERINRRIDTPDGITPNSPEFAKVPGLDYRGHRKKGHDPLIAGTIGFLEAGWEGAAAAEIHVGLDVVSDLIRKKYGSGVRDLIEAICNLEYDLCKEKHKSKKRRGRQRKSRKPAP